MYIHKEIHYGKFPLAGAQIYTHTQGHLVKIEWLVAGVTADGSLDRTERAILEVIVAGLVFGQSRSCLWSGSHFVV